VRVALVHPYSWPAVRRGGERYLHDLAQWLAGRGHQVDVITGSGPRRPDEGTSGVRFVRLPTWELASHGVTALDSFGATVLPQLLRERYDVVHSLVPSGALAAAATLLPSVYTVLGHPSPANRPASAWSRALFAQAVRRARVPAALSRSAADGTEGLTGRRPLVLSPGVRLETFTPRASPPTGPPRLLFNGDAGDPRKRLVVLLRAMPTVLAELPGIRLCLGGVGDPSEALDQLEPGLRRVVADVIDDPGTGDLGDVPDRYRAATISVLPSVDEAFGLVLVESLACGVPVVCSRSGGMPEIVTEDVGRLATPDDPADLARAVLEAVALAGQPGIGAACVARAAHWDWSRVGPQHELAYARARG
jgi:phosphatidylinositol alpha-mannosyltransferase